MVSCAQLCTHHICMYDYTSQHLKEIWGIGLANPYQWFSSIHHIVHIIYVCILASTLKGSADRLHFSTYPLSNYIGQKFFPHSIIILFSPWFHCMAVVLFVTSFLQDFSITVVRVQVLLQFIKFVTLLYIPLFSTGFHHAHGKCSLCRFGNSLFSFSCKSLVFWERKSKSVIRSFQSAN